LAAQLDDAARYVRPALALLAEAVLLELQHGGERERVIGAGDVDVVRADAGLAEHDVLGVIAGDAGDGPGGPVEIGPRLAPSAPPPPHVARVPPQITRLLRARHDEGGGVVRLQAA